MRKYLGIKFRFIDDADGRRYLTAVIWYPKNWTSLRYLYPAVRWF